MYTNFQEYLKKELAQIEADGLYKNERIIESPQGAEILVKGKKCLNFCANNYLGLGNNPELIEAAKRGMDERGFGMASVRFICGCQDLHKKLEAKIAEFFGTEDTILYAACFDANGGVFEPLLGPEDAIISDSLNMLLSSMEYVFARHSVSVMPTPTWKTLRNSYKTLRNAVSALSSPTVSSLWTATYVLLTRFMS